MVINPFRNRVQFIVERLLLSGTVARLAVGAAFIGAVALGMGALGYLVARGTEQSFRNPAEAVWWAFLRLTDSGYLGDDVGTGLRVVSTLVTVAGTVLFIGVLVAVLTQGLNEWIRKLEMGLTPINARHHVIVLGWSSRLPGLVRNMLESEQRLRRFLARIGAKKLKLVLLWDEVSPALTADLMAQVGAPRKTSRIILRSGSPLRLDHLTRVDYLRASAIVLPAENHRSPEGASRSDNSALKTILSISQSVRLADPASAPPLLVAELFDARKIPIALHNYRGPIEVVAGDEVVSRMLAQMVRHPQISQVYRELLTHGLGNELFARSCEGDLAGRSFWRLAEALPGALCIGVTQAAAGGVRSVLNPPSDYRFQATDKVIYVAREWEAGGPATSAVDAHAAAGAEVWPAPQKRLEVVRRADLRLLVVGWSRRIPAFVQELESYANQGFEITVASRCALAERERQLLGYGGQIKRVRMRHVETDCTVPEQLAALDPASFDVVLCLASDLAATDEEADARTLVEYAILQDIWADAAAAAPADDHPAPRKRPRLVLELLDELNVALIDPERCEYLLSPQVLSHMLGQVALRRELNAVFEQLFNSGETEITFRDVLRYGVAPGERIDFARLQSLARLHHEVALGYFSGRPNATAAASAGAAAKDGTVDPGAGGLMLNPGPAAAWTVSAGDRVVVLRN
jgi:hypothetical protein